MSYEKNFDELEFSKIRRNYIFSSIIFIFFLIYAKSDSVISFGLIKIENIVIIGEPYWNYFLLIFLFSLYSTIRYLIYGFDEIKKNKIDKIRLIDHLGKKTISLTKGVFLDKNNKIINERDIDIDIELSSIDIQKSKDNHIYLYFSQRRESDNHKDPKTGQLVRYKSKKICLDKIYEISIRGAKINLLFEDGHGEESINIVAEESIPFIKSIFNKEFSDYVWPLFLSGVVICLLIAKIIFFICN